MAGERTKKDSTDFKWLETEFRELHKRLDTQEEKLDDLNEKSTRIEIQTTKTNGDVHQAKEKISELEKQRDKYLESRVSKNDLDILCKEVQIVKKELDDNIIWGRKIVEGRAMDCPNRPTILKLEDDVIELDKKVETLKDDLLEYSFFKKYPKVAFGLITVMVVLLVISAIGSIETLISSIK